MAKPLPAPMMEMVAERFRALGEPARLAILDALRRGERTVSDIIAATQLSQANVSKHLRLLYALGFVSRRKEGTFTYYAVADKSIFDLCDLMCDRLRLEDRRRHRLIAS